MAAVTRWAAGTKSAERRDRLLLTRILPIAGKNMWVGAEATIHMFCRLVRHYPLCMRLPTGTIKEKISSTPIGNQNYNASLNSEKVLSNRYNFGTIKGLQAGEHVFRI